MLAVSIQSVCKRFSSRKGAVPWWGGNGAADVCALEDVSLDIAAGEVFVLAGPNGSGKSTLLKIVAAMLLPDSGHVRVCGIDAVAESKLVRAKVSIAVASDRSFYPRLSARENLEFFATFDGVERSVRKARVGDVLRITGLSGAADTLVYKFSSGMCQRLGIARALLKRPEVLLLDEPTRSLDPSNMIELWKFVNELKGERVSVLMASHNFEEAAAVGDRIGFLSEGRMRHMGKLTGSPEQIRAQFIAVCGGDTAVQGRLAVAGSAR